LSPILVRDLDPKFKDEISALPGGENLKACFACGTCTGGCPVSEIDERYDPRKIIRMILLGMRKEVLSSDLIWLCVTCFTCSFHCPQDVKFADISRILRDMAVKEGYVHPSFPKLVEEVDKFTMDLRRRMILLAVQRKQEGVEIEPQKLLEEALK